MHEEISDKKLDLISQCGQGWHTEYINTYILDTLKLLFLSFKTFIQPYTGTDFTFLLVNKRT